MPLPLPPIPAKLQLSLLAARFDAAAGFFGDARVGANPMSGLTAAAAEAGVDFAPKMPAKPVAGAEVAEVALVDVMPNAGAVPEVEIPPNEDKAEGVKLEAAGLRPKIALPEEVGKPPAIASGFEAPERRPRVGFVVAVAPAPERVAAIANPAPAAPVAVPALTPALEPDKDVSLLTVRLPEPNLPPEKPPAVPLNCSGGAIGRGARVEVAEVDVVSPAATGIPGPPMPVEVEVKGPGFMKDGVGDGKPC
jgi:hypothetical protein